MTMFLAPYTAIADIDGSPLDAGFIFFGEFGKNPESFPIPIYWDADFTIPAAQPIRTRNGYPIRNGSPCKIYLKQAEHSLVIKNKNLSAILVEMNNKGISSSLLVRPNGDTVETSLTNIDAELNNKQQQIDEKPSQQYVDEKLDLKAPKETTYTKLEVDSALSAKAPQETTYTKNEVDTAFSNLSTTANKYYSTLAAANDDIANIALNQSVTIGEEANSGLWEKKTAGATSLTKSPYDPLTQGKAYTADYVSKTGFAKIAGIAQTNINYDTATRTLTFSNTVHITTGTIRQQLTTPQSVVLEQNQMYRLEYNVSTGLIQVRSFTQDYIKGWIPFAFVRAYFDKIETSDFQYTVNGVTYNQISRAGYGVISASRSDSINFNSTTGNLEFEDEVKISTETTTYTLNTPVTVNFPTFGYFRLEYNVMTGAVRVQLHRQDRIENWVVLGLIRYSSSDGMISTNDFFYTVDDVLYTPEQFAIKSSSIIAEEKDRALIHKLITVNSNLYDANSAKIGYRVDPAGVEVADDTYCVSDYIDVSPLQDITIKAEQNNGAPYRGFNSISYYDLNKNFVKREGVDNTGNGSVDGAIVVTMPLDIYYIRLNMLSTSPDGYKRQINYGSTALTYEPHSKTLNPSINVDFNELWSVGTNSIEDRAITPEKTDFIEVSKNLFDKSQVILGKSIDSSGVIVDNAPTALSGYIHVKPSTNYIAAIFPESAVSTINVLTEFNSSGQFIKQTTFYAQAKPSFTTTSNTSQIVFSMTINSANLDRMLVEGSSVDAYEEFGVKRLVGIEVDTATSITPFGEYDRKMTDLPVDDVFTTDETYSEFAGFYDSEPSDVYALWDTLMSEHPTYITRKFMGQDAFGYDMYVYHLKPATLNAPHTSVEKRPKIGVTCAMHGFEKASTLTMYLLARDMCKNWRTDKLLEALRFNVEFVVMPIMNPSGYVDKTYKNRNGVNLNYNFPYKFDERDPRDPNDDYYGGTHALSEPETQYVVQMLDDHPDFDAFIDFHSFGGLSVELHPYVTYTSTSGGKIIPHMTQMLSGRLARILQKKYEFFPQDDDYQASRITNHGDDACMMKNYIYFERKIEQTATFEVGANIWHEPTPRQFSDVQKNCAVHSFYNWVLLNVNEICRR